MFEEKREAVMAIEPALLFGAAFRSVLVSLILPQRGQTNTCTIACSAATRADLDHSIGMLKASQIGEAKCSIDCLSLSAERHHCSAATN
jgi:hypothetical protein